MFQVCLNTEQLCNVCNATPAKYKCANGFGMCIECAEKIVVDVAATTDETPNTSIWHYINTTLDTCNACGVITAGMANHTTRVCMICINSLIDILPVVELNLQVDGSVYKEQTQSSESDTDSEPEEPPMPNRGGTRMCFEETSDCNTSHNVVASTLSELKEHTNPLRIANP